MQPAGGGGGVALEDQLGDAAQQGVVGLRGEERVREGGPGGEVGEQDERQPGELAEAARGDQPVADEGHQEVGGKQGGGEQRVDAGEVDQDRKDSPDVGVFGVELEHPEDFGQAPAVDDRLAPRGTGGQSKKVWKDLIGSSWIRNEGNQFF